MTTYLRSELRKLRYTRSLWGLPLAAVFISVVAATVLITSFEPGEIAPTLSQHGPLRFGATNTGLLLALFGIRAFGDETHHHTLASTYLASPNRRAVLAAKTVMSVATALAVSAAIYLVVITVTVISVEARGLPMTMDIVNTMALFGRVVAAMIAMTLLGLGLAAAIRNRALALVAASLWFALIEDAFGSLLRTHEWLPGALVAQLVRGTSDPTATPVVALALFGTVAAAAVAATTALRRDVT